MNLAMMITVVVVFLCVGALLWFPSTSGIIAVTALLLGATGIGRGFKLDVLSKQIDALNRDKVSEGQCAESIAEAIEPLVESMRKLIASRDNLYIAVDECQEQQDDRDAIIGKLVESSVLSKTRMEKYEGELRSVGERLNSSSDVMVNRTVRLEALEESWGRLQGNVDSDTLSELEGLIADNTERLEAMGVNFHKMWSSLEGIDERVEAIEGKYLD